MQTGVKIICSAWCSCGVSMYTRIYLLSYKHQHDDIMSHMCPAMKVGHKKFQQLDLTLRFISLLCLNLRWQGSPYLLCSSSCVWQRQMFWLTSWPLDILLLWALGHSHYNQVSVNLSSGEVWDFTVHLSDQLNPVVTFKANLRRS